MYTKSVMNIFILRIQINKKVKKMNICIHVSKRVFFRWKIEQSCEYFHKTIYRELKYTQIAKEISRRRCCLYVNCSSKLLQPSTLAHLRNRPLFTELVCSFFSPQVMRILDDTMKHLETYTSIPGNRYFQLTVKFKLCL